MIDVRELRINSHVLHNGKRFKVRRISDMGLVDIDGFIKEEEKIDPIPITPDLLKELGFEETKCIVLDRLHYEKHFDDCHIDVFKHYDDWVVHIDNSDFDTIGSANVNYLHEMESIIYIITKHDIHDA